MKKSLINTSMSFARKLLIGSSLSFGLVLLLISSDVLFQKNPSEEDKSDSWACLTVAIPPLAFGGWLIWDARRKKQEQQKQAERDFLLNLESIFLEQIQSNQGNISCISFASAAKISIEESQQYLEQKSNQLNSTFNIDDEGGTSYHFSLARSLM
jgi:hypothetical protein